MKGLKYFIPFVIIALSFNACGDDDDDNNNNNNNNSSTDYYFKINYNGNAYSYDNDFLQIGNSSPDEFGGWVPDNAFNYMGGIVFTFPDTATSAGILGLEGRTLNFSSTSVPEVEIKHLMPGTTNYSNVNSNSSYSVNITEVTFLRNENALFDIDVYAVKGTFTARMETVDGDYIDDATGEFFLQCTKGNY